ncbi:MAG: HAD family hydrolase, partial [Spirochaetota bacterium]
MHITHVVFDFGAVLAWPPSSAACDRLCENAGIPKEVLMSRYFERRAEYDHDSIAAIDYWRSIVEGFPAEHDEPLLARLALMDVESWSEPNPATVEWLPDLKNAGFDLGLLSNMPGPFWDVLRHRIDWLCWFDHTVISGKVKLSKPTREIYALLLETLACDPGEVLFLDDSEANVLAARTAGIHAEVYNVFDGGLAGIAARYSLPLPEEPRPDDARLSDTACAPHLS